VAGGVAGGVPGGVPARESAEVVRRVQPVYPPLAKQARIQGTVVLKVKIGTDGSVLDTQVVSGHPLLVPAAMDAVKQWVFQPVIKDGQAVEVLTDVTINFQLPAEPAAVESSSQPEQTPQRIRVGGNVQAMNLIEKVRPVYPPLAKQARIQGTVRFTAIIGRDGHVKDLQLESGHPLLVDAAQDTVSRWVYRATLLNGQPVEVITQIDINFTLTE
jgi:TonB family protein